ncbi:spermidine synthase-like [Physella acuta]|uniref:spermidine synthase-like n=1 Tax=Physella acuta TaxID=109671 RepID=UPI0027DCB0BD|nr:spermidine synthase-like [Physella acuta]XP_059174154.1 spermidine synthase-like [Physella acuta]XP_059174155.1 spermidine synthase-like [Physella acuta]XP_059174156.1 spermidine synthase-like [Physella acuta]XP_059174157.1 spermidine synthase-like [Physella acuta]XP_059174159.1 spermidine synthase-like [Physella acuta]
MENDIFYNQSVIEDGWFREVNLQWAGYSLNLQVEEVLYEGKSKYQDILAFKSKSFGNVLVLNGIIQCTEKDEFTYQEMITHIPMTLHPNPQKVLVIGGGDGGVVREVLKYESVNQVVLCEIDQLVIDVCRKHLPTMSCCLDNPRVRIEVGDGVDYVSNHPGEFDVIITDAPDPEGAAEALFQTNYYMGLKGALKADGIACCQGLTPFIDLPNVKKMFQQCRDVFPQVGYATGSTPTYASGIMGYLVASSTPNIDFTKPVRRLSEEDLKRMDLKYYNSDIHTASFVLPNYIREVVKDMIDT